MLCRPVVDDQRLRHGEWQMNMDLVVSWVFSVLREMFRFYPVNKPVSQILELLLRIVTKRRFASSNVNWIRKSKDLDRCVPTHILQEFYYALADTACFNMYCNSNSMKELRATRNFLKEKKYKKIKYRVFQKDLNIFCSGHRGHRTWHPVIFSYVDTLKTMPTNHHSPKCAWTARSHSSCGANHWWEQVS